MAGLMPIVAGAPGDQFTVTTDQRGHPLSSNMVFADGRAYTYALSGASALVAGDVIQAAAPTANHVLQTPTATAVGASEIPVTLGATAAVVDEYRDGYLVTQLGTAFGNVYTIKSHGAVSSGGLFTVPIRETVQVAIPATANSVSLIRNQGRGVIQAPVTTLTAMVIGIAPLPIAAARYCWIQTTGPAACTTIGTLVIGANAVTPTGTAPGALGPSGASTSVNAGRVMQVGTTTNKSLVYLALI